MLQSRGTSTLTALLRPTLRLSFKRSLQTAATLKPVFRPSPQMTSHGNFDLVKRIKLDFTDVEVTRWRSRVTGLSVVHLDCEGEFLV